MRKSRVLVDVGPMLVTFEPGSNHVAHVHLTNPTAAGWTYDGSITCPAFLTAYVFTRTVPAGGMVTVDIPVTITTGSLPPGQQAVWVSIQESGVMLFSQAVDYIDVVALVDPAGSATVSWD